MDGVLGAAATHVGNVRSENQDSHLVDPDAGVFVVADGMGGHAGGSRASKIAVATVSKAWAALPLRRLVARYVETGDTAVRSELVGEVRKGVLAAHRAISAAAAADAELQGMGTTFTGFLIAGGDAIFVHVGDSRAYLVRDGIALRLSEDHTVVAQLDAVEKRGTPLDYDRESYEGVLTGALGVGEGEVISTFIVPLYSGDRVVLCSDGVHQYVEEAEVGEVVLGTPSPARAAQEFVDRALAGGGEDNATVVVCKVVEAGTTRVPDERSERHGAVVAVSAFLRGLSDQQRETIRRISLPRQASTGQEVPPVAVGERVAYLVLEGAVDQDGVERIAGDMVYPDALLDPEPPAPARAAVAISDTELLMIRRDDFVEVLGRDEELAEILRANVEALARG